MFITKESFERSEGGKVAPQKEALKGQYGLLGTKFKLRLFVFAI